MTIAVPALSPSAVRPSRVGGFDATWLLWIAIIAVLLFLVVSPFFYLVLTSFTAERTGDFTRARIRSRSCTIKSSTTPTSVERPVNGPMR